jgi:hypothetical protein
MNYLRLKPSGWSAYSNGFTVVKDWNTGGQYFSDGGGDAFDNWGNFSPRMNLQPAEMTGADGVITSKTSYLSDHLEAVRLGWAAEGMLCFEVYSPTDADPVTFEWGGNLGSDASTQHGRVTTTFLGPASGSTYYLHTEWSNDGGMDSAGGDVQITRTFVEMRGDLAAANTSASMSTSFSGDNETSSILTQRGLTVIFNWGNTTVADVQAWVVANLVESTSLPAIPGFTPQVLSAPKAAVSPAEIPYVGVAPAFAPALRYGYAERDGNFRVRGNVGLDVNGDGIKDLNVQRKVLAYDESSMTLFGRTWSDPVTGDYAFDNIRGDLKLTIIAYDHTHDKRAVIADNITPEAMP